MLSNEYRERLLRRFRTQHFNDAEVFAAYAERGDYAALRKGAHAVKGAAATLAMDEVRRSAAAVEQGARDLERGRVAEAESAGAELRRNVRALAETMAAAFASIPEEPVGLETDASQAGRQTSAESTASIPAGERARLISRFVELLERNDSAVNVLFEAERRTMVTVLGQRAQRFAELLEDFDYPDALAILREFQ